MIVHLVDASPYIFRAHFSLPGSIKTPDGRPIGAMQLDTQDRAKKFVTDDLNLLSIVANLASVAVEKARMHEDAVVREELRRVGHLFGIAEHLDAP